MIPDEPERIASDKIGLKCIKLRTIVAGDEFSLDSPGSENEWKFMKRKNGEKKKIGKTWKNTKSYLNESYYVTAATYE